MFNRSRFLFPIGTDPQRWAERYDLTPFTGPCSDCGAMLTTTLPFVNGDLAGLAAPGCECGNENTPYCMIAKPGAPDILSAERYDV